jgi:N-acetylglutamate synthase-like GNAT family acetyltransferase
LQIRRANPSELGWVNSRYREIDFLPSEEKDFIAVAEIEDREVGLGRLTEIANGVGELGGIYVFGEFRNNGVATAVVSYLLQHNFFSTTYCLPFAHLEKFYKKFGFRDLKPSEKSSVPTKILDKLHYCTSTYEEPTLLLIRKA